MLSPDIIKRIREIEIHTRRLLSGQLVGDNSSAQKGSGFEFDQIRDYQFGDDVRFIDWKGTARSGKLLFKQYIEERNRTVVIAVDVSASSFFSSVQSVKADVIAQVAAVLALIADYGKDHASLVLFSDDVECVVPPNRGRKHIHYIMEKLFTHKTEKKGTNIPSVLKHIASMHIKNAIVFLISDFIDTNFEKPLRIVAKKYDLVAIRCLDENEQSFPNVGFLTVTDMETGKEMLLDTRKKKKSGISDFLQDRVAQQENLFKKAGIDYLDVCPSKPFFGDIVRFFRRRMMY